MAKAKVKKKPTLIPFDNKGNPISYTYVSPGEDLIFPTYLEDADGSPMFDENNRRVKGPNEYGDWVENYVFAEVMEISGIHRGRSAAQFLLIDSKKINYVMFLTDAMDMIQRGDIHQGQIAGHWTFQKRGANIGIRLATKEERSVS